MKEIKISVGDTINEEKITRISEDPFIKDQIDIFVDAYESDWLAQLSQKVYRIKHKKELEEND